MKRPILFVFACLLSWFGTHSDLSAQILNAERFGKNLDSTDVFKGNFNLSYSGARRVTIISNFKTGMDFSLRWKKSEFISSGAYSWLLSGKDPIRNEGFLHLRYRHGRSGAKVIPETFAQIQRDAILGMDSRVIAGQNLRITVQNDSFGVVYAGIGAFFETESWNYNGVPLEDNLPENPGTRTTEFIKANLYLSARREFTPSFSAGAVVYYQARPDAFFLYPRIASEISFNFKIGKGVGWRTSFSSMYDRLPVVPIYQFYFNTNMGIAIDF